MTNLASKSMRTPMTTTADEARLKAGFFRGMFFLLNQPVFEKKALERAMAQSEGVEDA
jgi:hypothetical protein